MWVVVCCWWCLDELRIWCLCVVRGCAVCVCVMKPNFHVTNLTPRHEMIMFTRIFDHSCHGMIVFSEILVTHTTKKGEGYLRTMVLLAPFLGHVWPLWAQFRAVDFTHKQMRRRHMLGHGWARTGGRNQGVNAHKVKFSHRLEVGSGHGLRMQGAWESGGEHASFCASLSRDPV